MNTNDEKTPHEFDELLEALWAGELDADEQARLEALAASDPALGERLRRERSLSTMLAGHGPNRAPEGLARAVFARLDAEMPPAAQPKRESARVITIPAWFTPTLRWGLAAAVILVCFTQLMWLIVHDRMGGQTVQLAYDVAPLPNPKTNNNSNLASYVPAKPTVKPELARNADKKEIAVAAGELARAIPQTEAPKAADKMIAAVRTPSPTPTAKAQAAQMPAAAPAVPIEKDLAKVIESSSKTTESKALASVVPTDTRQEAAATLQEGNDELIATPGKGALSAKPSLQNRSREIADLTKASKQGNIALITNGAPTAKPPSAAGSMTTASAEDKVIMRIVLRSQPEPALGTAQAPHAGADVGAMRGFAPGLERQGRSGIKTFAGGPPAAVHVQPPQQTSRRMVASAVIARHEVTHVQIEQMLTACGGSVKGVQQVRAVPAIWRIDGTIPQANMATFIERLGQQGIKAGAAENAQPNQYSILQGEDLLRSKTEPTTATQRVAGRKQHPAASVPLTLLVDEGRN